MSLVDGVLTQTLRGNGPDRGLSAALERSRVYMIEDDLVTIERVDRVA